MTPVPILYVVRQLDSGGLERDVAKLALGLDRTRFLPYVAAFEARGLRCDELRSAGVPVTDLEVTSLKSPKLIGSISRLVRLILGKKIRLVHAYDASAVFAAPLSRFLRVPAILSSTVGHRDLLDEKTKRQVQYTDRQVDAVVVNCEAMRRHLQDDYSVPPDRIALCYNGVDTTEFFPRSEPKPHPVADASLVIGSVCVLRAEKRMELLIQAFAKVRHLKSSTKLLIVGSGPELPKLQREALAKGVQDSCVFQPAVPAVAPFLRAMDVFVSCSSSEAFSNSILEAMACGCCPIGSRVGGTPELIADGERGLLFESNNVDDLAAKLSQVIADSDLRQRLSVESARFASSSLNLGIALNRMAEIYENILQGKGERL